MLDSQELIDAVTQATLADASTEIIIAETCRAIALQVERCLLRDNKKSFIRCQDLSRELRFIADALEHPQHS